MIRKSLVRWNDGTYDGQRICVECGFENCSYPVYNEYYKEIYSKLSYAAYLNRMGEPEFETEEVEDARANPDVLQATNENAD